MVEIYGHKINFDDKQIKQKLQKVLIAEIKGLLAQREHEQFLEEERKRGIYALCGDIKVDIDWKTLTVGYFLIGDWSY